MTELEQAFLGVEDLATMYRVKPNTVLLWHQQGRLPKPAKVGRKLLWRKSQMRELLKGPKGKD
jgi:hypothetical protein